LLGPNNHYGSFRVLGNLSVTIQGITQYANYNRSLDLDTGIHHTTFLGNDKNTYTTLTYCSYPAKVCMYRLSSTGKLPNVAVSLENRLIPASTYNASCGSSLIRLQGTTQTSAPGGMGWDVLARISTGPLGMPMSSCSTNTKGTIVVTGSAYGNDLILSSFSVIIGAASEYDQTKGDFASKFSFRGPKPGPALDKLTAQSSVKLENKLIIAHTQDYQKLMGGFQLELFDPWKGSKYPSETLEFGQLLDRYKYSAGISGNNKKRKTKRRTGRFNGKDIKRSLQELVRPMKAQQTTFRPSTTAAQTTWAGAAPTDAFPEFGFPTSLAKGVSHSAPIPWTTNTVLTVTGPDGKRQTLTLTSAAVSTGTANRGTVPPPVATTAAGAGGGDDGLRRKKNKKNKKKKKKRVLVDGKESADPPATAEGPVTFGEETVVGTADVRTEGDAFEADPSVAQGDPYMEALLFDYARHLFICSSRDDSLPPNLQGVWTDQTESAWSGDYHANINLQMNHWFADQVGLGHLQEALFTYMTNTWVPRGTETARLLYNAPGWVTHDEMNIFGHTGMKNTASWANCKSACNPPPWQLHTQYISVKTMLTKINK
jgi:hypothetical protein